MTVSKHTPGPWVAEVHDHGGFDIEADGQGKSGGLLVICSRNRHQERMYEFEANARLIAAAPELLEALQGALLLMEEQLIKIEWEYGECREIEAIEKDGDLPSAVIKARAAIAKATGVE